MPKTLVVVEDSQFARAILSKELKKHGFNIIFAEDAESGHIQILQMDTKPDLIILNTHGRKYMKRPAYRRSYCRATIRRYLNGDKKKQNKNTEEF